MEYLVQRVQKSYRVKLLVTADSDILTSPHAFRQVRMSIPPETWTHPRSSPQRRYVPETWLPRGAGVLRHFEDSPWWQSRQKDQTRWCSLRWLVIKRAICRPLINCFFLSATNSFPVSSSLMSSPAARVTASAQASNPDRLNCTCRERAKGWINSLTFLRERVSKSAGRLIKPTLVFGLEYSMIVWPILNLRLSRWLTPSVKIWKTP